MKKLIFGVAFVSIFVFGSHLYACDCDPATALLWGMKDRLHQPWPDDPSLQQKKTKDTPATATANAPKQEVQPQSSDLRSSGEVRK